MFQQSSEQILNDFSKYRSAVMGVYILSIALFHQHFLHSFPWNIFHYYGYWGVDVFLLLSGMGMVNALSKYPISIFFQHRIKRLLPSCIFCGILKCAIYLLIGSVIIIPKEIDLIDWGSPLSLDLWYIRAIIVYYVISPLLYRFMQHAPWMTILAVFILFIINELFFKTSDAGSPSWIIERLLVFCIGMLLMVKKKILSVHIIIVSTIFLIIAIFIVATLKNSVSLYSTIPWTIYIFTLAIGALALTYLSVLFLKTMCSTLVSALNWLGNFSLEIYLIHQSIYTALPLIGCNWCPPFGMLILCLILSFFIAYTCKYILNILCFHK
jgi:peptidoglycan/LPS O-acetylase OafA/YrhL